VTSTIAADREGAADKGVRQGLALARFSARGTFSKENGFLSPQGQKSRYPFSGHANFLLKNNLYYFCVGGFWLLLVFRNPLRELLSVVFFLKKDEKADNYV
jgi:hypothetical protein